MHEGKFVFSQLMEFVPWRRFQTCVNRYGGDYKVGTYQCVEQFRVMAFAQLTYRHSLREVEACLRVVKPKLYHMGIHSSISHSNLAHANQFEKTPLIEALSCESRKKHKSIRPNQLVLFE